MLLILPVDSLTRTHSEASLKTMQQANNNGRKKKPEEKSSKSSQRQQRAPRSIDLSSSQSSLNSYGHDKRYSDEKDAKRLAELRQSSCRTDRTHIMQNGESSYSLQAGSFNFHNSIHLLSSRDDHETSERDAITNEHFHDESNHSNNAVSKRRQQRKRPQLAEIESRGSTSSKLSSHLLDHSDMSKRFDDLTPPFMGGSNADNNSAKIETDMKRTLAKKLCYPRQWLYGFSSFRNVCGAVVNHPKVQLVIILMIVVNAIMMGIGTFDFVTQNPQLNFAFNATDKAFLVVFTIEIAMQFAYRGRSIVLDGWLLFDLIIVLMSWSTESLQVFRTFRIFRAFRLVTRLTVLRNLVLALFAVAPSMTAIIFLLCLILYIYGVLCTVLFKDLYELGVTEENYFGRLDITLFTLFQMMTLEWADIVRQVMDEYYWAWAVFSSFLVLTSFILYSLIIAVVCDAVKVQEHQEEMAEHVRLKEETRQRVFTLEMRVGDMTQQQLVILESLQSALKELRQAQVENEKLREHFLDVEEETTMKLLEEDETCGEEDDEIDRAGYRSQEGQVNSPKQKQHPKHQYHSGSSQRLGYRLDHRSANGNLDGTTNHAVAATFGESEHAVVRQEQHHDDNHQQHASLLFPTDIDAESHDIDAALEFGDDSEAVGDDYHDNIGEESSSGDVIVYVRNPPTQTAFADSHLDFVGEESSSGDVMLYELNPRTQMRPPPPHRVNVGEESSSGDVIVFERPPTMRTDLSEKEDSSEEDY